MKTILIIFTIIFLSYLGANSQIQQTEAISDNKYKTPYLIYTPETELQTYKTLPLLLFLHGTEDCGSNLENVKRNGLPKLIKEGQHFPFIIVSPQCKKGQHWNSNELISLIHEAQKKYPIDANRIYLTGFNTGGTAAWNLAAKKPSIFAAVVPIAAEPDENTITKLKKVPLWVFHGEKDEIVMVEKVEQLVQKLTEAGGNVLLTTYPDLAHDAWTTSYNNPDLYDWLWGQTKR